MVAAVMSNEPFFTREGAAFQPTLSSRGPWDPKSLHGRVIAGLLGYEIERTLNDPAFMPARLTVDMYRLPDLSPVEVTTRVVRDGGRLKVIDAEFFSAGVSMARATCQLLRRTENPAGTVWGAPELGCAAARGDPGSRGRAERHGRHVGDQADLMAHSAGTGKRQVWMREVRELIGGVPLTPFTRLALAADFSSPFANSGDQGLAYINSDLTLYLHRAPVTEWIGFEVVNHHATEGVAIGECWLYDEQGPIGSSTVGALAQRRGMG